MDPSEWFRHFMPQPTTGVPPPTGVPTYGTPMFVPPFPLPVPVPIWEQPPPPMDMWYADYFANTPVFRDREVSGLTHTHLYVNMIGV